MTGNFQLLNEKIHKRGEPAIVFISFFSLYVSTLCGVNTGAHDSVIYMFMIAPRKGLFFLQHPSYHPHHLIYNKLAQGWLAIFRFLDITADMGILVSLLNAIFGALTLTVFYLILRNRLKMERLTAFLGTALPALSFGFWFYSVCVELCIPPLLFLLTIIYLLTAEYVDKKTFASVGLLHGLAILLHQVHVLFSTVIIAAIFFRRKQKTAKIRESLLNYLRVIVPLVLIPYLVVIRYFVNLDFGGRGWDWLTAYGQNPDFWNSFSPGTAVKAAIGSARSFIGLNYIFSIPRFQSVLNKICKGHSLMDETFLVRDLGETSAYILLALSAITAVVLLVSVIIFFKNRRSLDETQANLRLFALVWFATYTLFFFFWVPDNVEFWISQSICLWLGFLVLLSSYSGAFKAKRNILLSGMIVLLFVTNYGGSIKFLSDNKNDFYYQKIASLLGKLRENDLVIIDYPAKLTDPPVTAWDTGILHSYLFWYTKAGILNLRKISKMNLPSYTLDLPLGYWLDINEMYGASEKKKESYASRVHASIDKALNKGGKVYIYSEAVKLEETGFLKEKIISLNKKLWSPYQDRWRKKNFGQEAIYVLD